MAFSVGEKNCLTPVTNYATVVDVEAKMDNAKTDDRRCWFGKTAGTQCEHPGKWRWAGKFWSDWVRESVWCDEHRGGAYVAICQHPMHDDDCPHGCEAPAPACVYCQSTDDTHKRKGEPVCGPCSEDLDRGDEMDREQMACEQYVDQKISEWKEAR